MKDMYLMLECRCVPPTTLKCLTHEVLCLLALSVYKKIIIIILHVYHVLKKMT